MDQILPQSPGTEITLQTNLVTLSSGVGATACQEDSSSYFFPRYRPWDGMNILHILIVFLTVCPLFPLPNFWARADEMGEEMVADFSLSDTLERNRAEVTGKLSLRPLWLTSSRSGLRYMGPTVGPPWGWSFCSLSESWEKEPVSLSLSASLELILVPIAFSCIRHVSKFENLKELEKSLEINCFLKLA